MKIINMNLEINVGKNVLKNQKNQKISHHKIIIIVKLFVQGNILLNFYQLKNVLKVALLMILKKNYVF